MHQPEALLVCRVNSGAYFPVPELPKSGGGNAVNPTPGASGSSYVYGIKRPPPPILPPAGSSSDFMSLSVTEDYGPATAPYPPPAASVVMGGEQLVDNEEAIT
jgi:hypothetical protein